MKKLLAVLILAAAVIAQAGNVNVVNPPSKPVPVTNVGLAGTTALAPNYYAAHITTSATTTVTSSTAYLNSIVITTTNAGTTWALRIQNKEGTPKVIYNIAAVAVGTVTIPLQGALLMTSGIDIITTGATPGVVDVFLNYGQ
jgi:photosystem II stability/assembly factor-like uncharacterized protein